ncbi:PadR family transcriptional regulator [Halocatena salina]|uniref:PadR family transcriptional regulator n=1 Tax=Halocatena salina TaxID=2934340 RepID=A0A8U0AB42_9EURY|nr:PadR family transcriptional regulator [Halocatena salina]UPM45113.1 PadR family transcriptional regulator [Halocatena salina]
MSVTVSDDSELDIAHELTAFQQRILAILAEEARYGLAIKSELEEYYGSDVNHGRLYPNLDDLVEMGLVEKSELDRRTNEYALTEAGHDAIVNQLAWTFSRFIISDSRAEEINELISATQE